MEKERKELLGVNIVAEHEVYDTKDGQHFDYWKKFVVIGKVRIPIKLDKNDYVGRAYLHEKLGID